MIIKHFSSRIGKVWVKRFCTVLSLVLVAIAVGFSSPAAALAAPTVMADMSEVQQKAKEAFDDVFGSGASDRVEGNIDQSTGELKKQAGKIKGQLDDDMTAGMGDRIEGQFDQTMGKGKEQMGKVKGRVDDAFNQAEMMGEKKARSIESAIEEKSNY